MPSQDAVAEPRYRRRTRPGGVCGPRPRSPLPRFVQGAPGIIAVLRLLEHLPEDDLAQVLLEAEAWTERLRCERGFNAEEAGEIVRLHEKGAGTSAENEVSAADRERFETSRYRDHAITMVLFCAAKIELGRRREDRDPLYVGPTRYAQVSKRTMRRWGHLRPSEINRIPVAQREIARELYGHCQGARHRRAPGRKPIRRPGSRRTPAPTRGDPDDGDPEPPAPAPGARRQHETGGAASEQVAADRRPTSGPVAWR